MTQIDEVNDHGLEVLKKSAINPDDTHKVRYALRTYNINSMSLGNYDAVSVTYPTDTSEIYVFKSGGLAGTTLATVTLTYVNSSKDSISTVVKT